jgi:predicted nucleotide-binding protein
MARKPPPPETSRAPKNAQQLKQGIERIQKRIADLEAFQPEAVKERWASETQAIEAAIADTLDAVFGQGTERYNRFSAATNIDHGAVIMFGGPTPLPEVHQYLREGRANAIALLRQAVRSLEEDLGDLTEQPTSKSHVQQSPATDEIFIVHGRDSPAKIEVARLIERAGLRAVILHEQANQGRTIIEKFEDHGGTAGFAIIVLTPDDVGGLDKDNLKPRARQNVIGEMFWFAGKLGRHRVCALKKSDVEMPSDFAGIGYTDMDDRGAWKAELLRELQAAGYANLNWSKALA